VTGRAGAFTVLLWSSTVLTLSFLLLPIVAIFLRVSPLELLHGMSSGPALDALIAGSRFKGRDLAVTLVELPLVLPPAVAGIGLLAAFGRLGLLGGTFEALGIDIAFTRVAVIMAVAFVASPFYLRAAIAGFEAIDPNLPAAARTLGAGPARTFFRVALPLAAGGLGAGAALAFARGIGEFGATIMFAGNIAGKTQTLPLVVYGQFQSGDLDASVAAAAILVIAAFAVLVAVRGIGWGRALDLRGA
jgi:molybdate transport system permease protein